MSEKDHARPIPQGPRQAGDDDVYVVDTRGRRHPPRSRGTADRSRSVPSGPASRAATPAPAAPPPPGTAYDEYGRPVQPSAPAARRPGGPPPRRGRARRRRRGRGRSLALALVVTLLGWVAFTAWAPWHAWSTVTRVDTTPDGNRPGPADGHTYLLVGSDSREGLSAEQKKALGTGSAEGRRTDTIILVHVPSGGGKASLISIPRDSYLPIPGNGQNKVNAAFAIGGPKLLVETVEQATGLPVDGYVEIGLGGFADVVDSLGGVYLCVPRDIKDDKAHIDLKEGCQTLDGPDALGYVRARYSDPRGDIGRAERQRQFLGAVMKQAATPSTVLIPWRWWSFTHAAAGNLVVGEDTSLLDSYRILSALRGVSSGDTLSLVVPLASTNTTTSAGSSVIWNAPRAEELFGMLRDGTPLDKAPAGTDGIPTG
jgi:LCP family protein required for cell wall assembly